MARACQRKEVPLIYCETQDPTTAAESSAIFWIRSGSFGLAGTSQELTTHPNWSILLRRRSRGEAEKGPELKCSGITSELTQSNLFQLGCPGSTGASPIPCGSQGKGTDRRGPGALEKDFGINVCLFIFTAPFHLQVHWHN